MDGIKSTLVVVDEAARWQQATMAARVRYTKEIRRYRKIHIMRIKYHQRRRGKW